MEIKLENETQIASDQFNKDRIVLEIVTGKRGNSQIFHKRLVGHAYLPVGSDTYEIKLMMLPRHVYFMRRSRDSIYRYTVFAKRFLENEQTKMNNPVGYGRLCSDLKNYVEVYFPLFGRLVFIDLVPKN